MVEMGPVGETIPFCTAFPSRGHREILPTKSHNWILEWLGLLQNVERNSLSYERTLVCREREISSNHNTYSWPVAGSRLAAIPFVPD
jgi:hypothetical protein